MPQIVLMPSVCEARSISRRTPIGRQSGWQHIPNTGGMWTRTPALHRRKEIRNFTKHHLPALFETGTPEAHSHSQSTISKALIRSQLHENNLTGFPWPKHPKPPAPGNRKTPAFSALLSILRSAKPLFRRRTRQSFLTNQRSIRTRRNGNRLTEIAKGIRFRRKEQTFLLKKSLLPNCAQQSGAPPLQHRSTGAAIESEKPNAGGWRRRENRRYLAVGRR